MGKEKNNQITYPPLTDSKHHPKIPRKILEKPWRTLEANILELKDKSYQQENLLQRILSNTSGSDCGLPKIEASELQEKIKLLE